MKERTKEYSNFEFGYNGQMKSDEVYGKGNLNTALFWEMDTRIGRRWNLDPEGNEDESSYSVFGGNPITNTDVNGDSWTDPIAGAVIGTVTNVIPFTGQIRDMYTPDDSREYNNMLRSSDNTMLVVGVGGTKAGTGIAATGGTVSLSGVVAVVGVPAAAVGGVVALSGAVVTLNALSNQSQGYNRGKKKQASKPEAKQNRAKSKEKNIPDSQIGPSGKPKIHTVEKSSIKQAKDAARNNRKANNSPVKHTNDQGQKGHFHSRKNGGKLKGKDNVHYNYPSRKNPKQQ